MSCAGRIELILGPMFAGKTTELMRRVRRETHSKRSCFIIKYRADTRYSKSCVSSHDKQMIEATVAVAQLSREQFDCIAIDEGQFFPDLVEFASRAAAMGKTVVVSALDGEFRRQPFGRVCELIPHAEKVEKLTAVCMMCHAADAYFSRRIVASEQQELIGGSDIDPKMDHPRMPPPWHRRSPRCAFRRHRSRQVNHMPATRALFLQVWRIQIHPNMLEHFARQDFCGYLPSPPNRHSQHDALGSQSAGQPSVKGAAPASFAHPHGLTAGQGLTAFGRRAADPQH
jgi:thymidine kinase